MHLNLGQNILFCFFHHTCLPLLQCLETTPVSFQINLFFSTLPQIFCMFRGQKPEALRRQVPQSRGVTSGNIPLHNSQVRRGSFLPQKKKPSHALRSVLRSKDKLTCVREAHYLILQNHRTMVIIPSNFHQSCPGLQKLLLNLMTQEEDVTIML